MSYYLDQCTIYEASNLHCTARTSIPYSSSRPWIPPPHSSQVVACAAWRPPSPLRWLSPSREPHSVGWHGSHLPGDASIDTCIIRACTRYTPSSMLRNPPLSAPQASETLRISPPHHPLPPLLIETTLFLIYFIFGTSYRVKGPFSEPCPRHSLHSSSRFIKPVTTPGPVSH